MQTTGIIEVMQDYTGVMENKVETTGIIIGSIWGYIGCTGNILA